MNSFYMIPNLLKDGDYAITNEIREYIESKGCRCTVAEKDSSGHILPEPFLTTYSAAWSLAATAR